MDPNESSALDPPNHLFRIRLACVLLETCGNIQPHKTTLQLLTLAHCRNVFQ